MQQFKITPREVAYQMIQFPWLESVGREIEVDLSPVRYSQLADREGAFASAVSPEWGNVGIDKIGDLTSYLHRNHILQFSELWNKLAMEVNDLFEEVLRDKISLAVDRERFPGDALNVIRQDVCRLILETVWSSASKNAPSFFGGIGKLYAQGKFPCGWIPDSDGRGGTFLVY
jgi:hypothetical protein